MTAKNFVGNAAATTLTAGITSGTMTLSVADGSTYPSANFNIVIDRGLVGEEKIFITSRSSNTLTVSARGADNTTASAHSLGATVEHCGFAADFQENNDHVNGSGTVHTNATVSPAVLIIPGATSPAQTAEGSAVWDTDDNLLTVGTASARKTMVDTDSTQTLSAKTLSGAKTTSTFRISTDDDAHDLSTGWTTYTPTFTNITGAAGEFAYKYLGAKTLVLRYDITAGTATATGLCYFSLPATTVNRRQSGGGSSVNANWLADQTSTNFILAGGSNITIGGSVQCVGSAILQVA